MHLGIDLGTTRTVVARVDRGNYPVLAFLDTVGDPHEFMPSVAADRDGDLVFGFDALAAAEEGAPLLRSFKRLMGDAEASPTSRVSIGEREHLLLDVVTGFLHALREAIDDSPAIGAPSRAGRPHQVVVSVPAHAPTVQRFLTLEAFRGAGFEVLALMNEPSAAGFEYTHRRPRTLSSKRTRILVYDLGGGTFDASLVSAEASRHEVLGSVGVNRLGGDDVDVLLAQTALRSAGEPNLTRAQWRRLLAECRDAKERLTPQSRRLVVDLDGDPVLIEVDEVYRHVTPLIEQSVTAMEPLVGRLEADEVAESLAEVAGVYLVGGASGLPLVPRVLRQRFGRRVFRSPYPAAATAIGLAIAADPESDFTMRDRLSRSFGVFREQSAGSALGFDEILSPDASLPSTGDAVLTRRYRAAHNVGWFRYVEYPGRDILGEPSGELTPFAEVLFPFDPALREVEDLTAVPIRRTGDGPEVEERYAIDSDGLVHVTITVLEDGYSRSFGLR
ncbi:Hsp70 family protein [Serinibacter salmoneus]|uniref:Chaperone protein HscA n=1 Tax=Serinibacter salmoneus TaxID=556530 RepID=A0A2A9D270_9MICO|nr:Hsp70 family protein [Serinibacter salmoneus]PFG19950.1 chaperone protein HscA [Serinibacter salmoneus]